MIFPQSLSTRAQGGTGGASSCFTGHCQVTDSTNLNIPQDKKIGLQSLSHGCQLEATLPVHKATDNMASGFP